MGMEVTKTLKAVCDQCDLALEFTETQHEIPDGVWRFLTLVWFDDTRKLFCSKRCLQNYLEKKFVPLQSPGEIRKADEEARAKAVVDSVSSSSETQEFRESIQRVRAENDTPEKARRLLQEEGVLTASGELTSQYGGANA